MTPVIVILEEPFEELYFKRKLCIFSCLDLLRCFHESPDGCFVSRFLIKNFSSILIWSISVFSVFSMRLKGLVCVTFISLQERKLWMTTKHS